MMSSQRHRAPWSLRAIPLAGYVFFLVFVLRLIALVRFTESPLLLPTQGDMHFYSEWGQHIARGEFTDHQAFYGLPLYAYLLAGIYALVGYGPFVPGLIQAVLDAGTAVLIFKISRRVFDYGQEPEPGRIPFTINRSGTPVGLLAALGWAFFVPAQAYSVILMPTAWLVFIFWFVVWRIVRTDAAPDLRQCLLLGLLIGVTAMGIATIFFAVPLLAAAILFRRLPDRTLLRRGMAILLLAGGILLGTAPAWLHNTFAARDPVFLSAHSGVNFWIGNNPAANGYPRIPPGLRAGQEAMLTDSIRGAEAAVGRPLQRSEVSAFWSAKAKAYIAQNPGAWLRLMLTKVTNFWNAFQYDDLSIITTLRGEGVILPGLHFGLVAALALPAIGFAVFSSPPARWVLGAVLLHMASLLSVFVTERYRLAAVPGLLIFAAFGLWTVLRFVITKRYRATALYAALLALAVWFVSVRRGDAELWALDPYNSGLHALEANRLDLAQEKLQLAYAHVPGNAEVNFALGNLRLAHGDTAGAQMWYGRTLALDPRHEGSFNNLGVIALEQRDAPTAVHLFEQALSVESRDAKTHYLLARALFETGERERALSEVEIALRLIPAQPQFRELKERILAR